MLEIPESKIIGLRAEKVLTGKKLQKYFVLQNPALSHFSTGNNGGYKKILSKDTSNHPCPNCGNLKRKGPYLGGAVYFCPSCQKP